MPDYPDVTAIRERLPYTASALGFKDADTYDAVLADLREEEIGRIESWVSLVDDATEAAERTDGGDPAAAFEELTIDATIDGRAAVRTPREVNRRSHTRVRHSDRRLDFGHGPTRQDTRRARTLPLPVRPVQSVESVTLLDRDDELELGADVYREGDTLVLDRTAPRSEWPTGRRNVHVEYTAGYDGIPARVRAALVDLVHVRLINDEALAVNSESIDGDSVDYRDPGEILSSAFGTILSDVESDHNGGVFSM